LWANVRLNGDVTQTGMIHEKAGQLGDNDHLESPLQGSGSKTRIEAHLHQVFDQRLSELQTEP
jgi:hypothetical protein